MATKPLFSIVLKVQIPVNYLVLKRFLLSENVIKESVEGFDILILIALEVYSKLILECQWENFPEITFPKYRHRY